MSRLHREWIIRRLSNALLGLVIAALPVMAGAHGALAVGSNGAYGYSYNYSSVSEAQQAALSRCINAGGVSCSVRGSIDGSYAAFARGSNYAWGWAYAGTSAEAQNLALQYCRQVTSNCSVLATWNDRSTTPSPGPTTSSKPSTGSSGEGLSMSGNLSYSCDGTYCVLGANTVQNDGTHYTTSGSLRLELWRLDAPYSGTGGVTGYKVAQHGLGQLRANYTLSGISSGSVPQLVTGLAGKSCSVVMLLTMYDSSSNNDGYRIVDYLNFSNPWGDCGSAPARLSDTDCLFSWAESHFSQLFAPNGRSNRQDGGWVYRSYDATGINLGFYAEQIYLWGSFYGSAPFYIGPMASYLPTARADACR